jgi:uncharacterized protein
MTTPGRPDSIFVLNGRMHPIWRVLLYVAAFFVSTISVQALVVAGWLVYRLSSGAPLDQAALMQLGRSPSLSLLLSLSVVQVIDVLALTYLFCRFIDRKPFRSLGLDTQAGWTAEALVGFLLGLAAMALIFAVEIGAGWAVARPAGGSWDRLGLMLLGYLVTYVAVAVDEELMFRGYLLQTLMEWPGTWWAALLSALIFSAFHGLNPGVSGLALAHLTVAGLVFAGSYLATRRLWLAMGLHFAWNFFQGPVFGFPVSGVAPNGLVSLHVTGPALFTGGAFGPEGGLLGLGALLLCGLGIWVWARRKTRISDQRQHTD